MSECVSCRELCALVRDALRLRNSRFLLDLVHDLVGKHLGVIPSCIGLTHPRGCVKKNGQ